MRLEEARSTAKYTLIVRYLPSTVQLLPTYLQGPILFIIGPSPLLSYPSPFLSRHPHQPSSPLSGSGKVLFKF